MSSAVELAGIPVDRVAALAPANLLTLAGYVDTAGLLLIATPAATNGSVRFVVLSWSS